MTRFRSMQLEVLEPETCANCGLCCEGVGSPVVVYVTRDDEPVPHPFRPPGLPAELQQEIDEAFGGLYRGEEPQESCLWFDPETRSCRHYEWRPPVCRDYEFGGRACLVMRRPHVRRPPAVGDDAEVEDGARDHPTP